MARLAVAVSLALPVLLLSGCGTVLNTTYFTAEEGGGSVYGGVRLDLETSRDLISETPPDDENVGQCISRYTMAVYTMLIDLPLSAIGDTLTLPITISGTYLISAEKEPAQHAEPPKVEKHPDSQVSSQTIPQ
jgi:uncharacterized protein YceK